MEISKQKRSLRDQVQSRLNQLSFFEIVEKTGLMREQFDRQLLVPYPHWLHQKYIVSFYPFEFEPQLNIEDERRNEPYRLAYVRITDWKNRVMIAAEARRDQPDDWEEIEPVSGLRIFQPHPKQRPCLANEIAIIFVPGVAFSEQGHRLGRGGGFYDRFLKLYPQALRVGLAFSDQIINSIPTEPLDQNVDVVLTDAGIFETKYFSEWRIHGKIESRE